MKRRNRYSDIDPMEVGATASARVAFRPVGMSSGDAYSRATGILTDLQSSNPQRRANAQATVAETSRAAKAGDPVAQAGMKVIRAANVAQKKKRKFLSTGKTKKGERHRGYLVTHEGRIIAGEFEKT